VGYRPHRPLPLLAVKSYISILKARKQASYTKYTEKKKELKKNWIFGGHAGDKDTSPLNLRLNLL
jgi:hypothetical protein